MAAKIFLLTIFLQYASLLSQDRWTRVYGGTEEDWSKSGIQTIDGEYIICGTTTSFSNDNSDVWVIKISASGETLWERSYNPGGSSGGGSIIQVADESILIAGDYRTQSSDGFWLIKANTDGDTLWTRKYPDPSYSGGALVAIIESPDVGYLMLGWMSIGGNVDFYAVKVDSSGDILWTQYYGGSEDDYARSMTRSNDNGYLLYGTTESFGAGNTDQYLVKINATGEIQWSRTYGGSQYDYGSSITQLPGDGYLLAGTSGSGAPRGYAASLTKIDTAGETEWSQTYGGNHNDAFLSVIPSLDQGFVLAGYTWSFGAGESDYWLVKTDFFGDTLWTQTYGGNQEEQANEVIQTFDEGFLIIGYTDSFTAGQKGSFIVKTDASGNTGSYPTVSIESQSMQAPSESLSVYPNPTNQAVQISYTLYSSTSVQLIVYDITGRIVWSENLHDQSIGRNLYYWPIINQNGLELSSGLYILNVFEDQTKIETMKIAILK